VYSNSVFTISGTPTAAGTFNYTVTATGTCNTVTATGTIKVDPKAVGGVLSPEFSSGCTGANGGTITLSGQSGNVVRWEASTNGGTTWSTINNTSASLTYSNLAATTLYRAVIKSGVCPETYSKAAVASIVPKQTPVPTANPSTICIGQSSILTATSGLPTSTAGVDGSFNQANPPGWCVDGNCSGSVLPANGDNQQTGPWRETNPQSFVGITYTSPQPKFAIANGVFTSVMETPAFSLIGQYPASLDFYQAYILNGSSTATIEISTDGGATYSKVLAQYTNGQLGISGSSSTMQSTSISLADYIGLSNLKIRFTYKGLDQNSAWTIDGLGFPGSVKPVVTQWTFPDGSTQAANTLTVSPTTTTTYKLVTMLDGCVVGTADVTVIVNPVPVATVNSATICEGSSTTITATPASGSTTDYTYAWTVPTGATNPGNFASFSTSIGGSYSVVITNKATGCASLAASGLVTVNTVTAGVMSADQAICSATQPAQLAATTAATGAGTLSYQWQSNTSGCTSAFTNISGATSANYTPPTLTATTYYRRITTSVLNGVTCTATSTCITVTVKPVMTMAACSSTPAVCNGSSTGSVSAGEIATPSGTVTYSWKNSAGVEVGTTSTVNNLPAGSYTVTVKDECTTLPCTVTITEPPVLAATISGTIAVCEGTAAPLVTFSNPQAYTVVITYNINGGASLTINVGASTTATVAAPTNVAGVFHYNLVSITQVGAPACANPITGEAIITVNPKPVSPIIYHN
jgi:hypothetical protein